MIANRQEDVTSAVTAMMERTTDDRLREIMFRIQVGLHRPSADASRLPAYHGISQSAAA
jgi:hypothetical protein